MSNSPCLFFSSVLCRTEHTCHMCNRSIDATCAVMIRRCWFLWRRAWVLDCYSLLVPNVSCKTELRNRQIQDESSTGAHPSVRERRALGNSRSASTSRLPRLGARATRAPWQQERPNSGAGPWIRAKGPLVVCCPSGPPACAQCACRGRRTRGFQLATGLGWPCGYHVGSAGRRATFRVLTLRANFEVYHFLVCGFEIYYFSIFSFKLCYFSV